MRVVVITLLVFGSFASQTLGQQTKEGLHSKECVNSTEMKLVFLPPGKFLMGCPLDGKKTGCGGIAIQHEVSISSAFCLGVFEVTQGQWKSVLGSEPWKGQAELQVGDDYPAVFVSFLDTVSFCRKLSIMEGKEYRLPTEAEWEYACRAGTTTA